MADITWIDIIIVVIFLISTTIALLRGFVREAISITTWIAAIWLALQFSEQVSFLLPSAIDGANFSLGEDGQLSNLRVGIAFVLIMIGTLIFGALINFVLSQVMKTHILRGVDRILGMFFGLARASVIITILIMTAAAFTTMPESSTWKTSRLIKPFEHAAIWVVQQLPEHYAHRFKFQAQAPKLEYKL